MNIFDEVNENLFRPLIGTNKRKYVDILTLIWDKCKRMPMYSIEKSTIFDMVEEYFCGLDCQVELDAEEQEETGGNTADVRALTGGFVRRLKNTGWLIEKEGEYEEESMLAVNYKVVPLLKTFQEIISPTIITYVLIVLQAITELDKETYIRNFSTALFKDSKIFQKEYRSTIESILFDYTDEVVEKSEILGFYNLYENPTYVWIKGNAVIEFVSSVIDIREMPDGIALSNASLKNIKRITVKADKVITVENLTTYHDSDEELAVHIYLGGYHNHTKQVLLEKVYADNKDKGYYHKGDLDVYGFLILENLKEKTGIPFKPLMMDLETLEKLYHAGLYKELKTTDVKVIKEKQNTILEAYKDVLEFMLDNNCKAEQESFKALELMG